MVKNEQMNNGEKLIFVCQNAVFVNSESLDILKKQFTADTISKRQAVCLPEAKYLYLLVLPHSYF